MEFRKRKIEAKCIAHRAERKEKVKDRGWKAWMLRGRKGNVGSKLE